MDAVDNSAQLCSTQTEKQKMGLAWDQGRGGDSCTNQNLATLCCSELHNEVMSDLGSAHNVTHDCNDLEVTLTLPVV